jgi:hypothetical protein
MASGTASLTNLFSRLGRGITKTRPLTDSPHTADYVLIALPSLGVFYGLELFWSVLHTSIL